MLRLLLQDHLQPLLRLLLLLLLLLLLVLVLQHLLQQPPEIELAASSALSLHGGNTGRRDKLDETASDA